MTVAALLAAIAIHTPVALPAQVVAAPCPGVMTGGSCYVPRLDRIYVDPARIGSDDARLRVGHELGHVFDAKRLTDGDRLAFMAVLGEDHWWPNGHESNDPMPGAEVFADAYSFCGFGPSARTRLYRRERGYRGVYGERLPRRIVAVACWLARHRTAPVTVGSSIS